MSGSTALLYALGLVGVAFGIGNIFVGVLGAGFDMFWIGANLVAGVVLLAAAVFSNLDALRERMSSGEARRAGRYGSSALVSTVLVLGILGMLGFLSTWKTARWDLSEQKVHSLTSQSLQVLQGLDQDVDVVALFPTLDQQAVRDVLDRYAHASDRFRVTYADPNEHPELLARYGITADQLGQGLVRVAMGGEAVNVQDVTEEKLTNAMVKLTRTGEKKIYFLEGHNERGIDGEVGDQRDGFARAAESLRNENYDVEKLLLAAKGSVPEDADVVVIAGPTRPLLDVERKALAAYLARGGSLLVMVDPRANTNLIDELRSWGVDVGDDIIVDRALALFGRATTPFAADYSHTNPITKDMHETTLFHVARSMSAAKGSGLTDLVMTGDSSWAERDLDTFFSEGTAELGDGDLPGPVSLAVAGTPKVSAPPAAAPAEGGTADEGTAAAEAAPAEGGAPQAEPASAEAGSKAETGRLVAFGDADFASNDLIETSGNRDLFVNSVNWLMGDVDAISIRPRVSRASRFQLSQEQFLRIRSLSLFVLPEVIAIIGVVVWWTRRRAPGR